jgi:hypothetical protein
MILRKTMRDNGMKPGRTTAAARSGGFAGLGTVHPRPPAVAVPDKGPAPYLFGSPGRLSPSTSSGRAPAGTPPGSSTDLLLPLRALQLLCRQPVARDRKDRARPRRRGGARLNPGRTPGWPYCDPDAQVPPRTDSTEHDYGHLSSVPDVQMVPGGRTNPQAY